MLQQWWMNPQAEKIKTLHATETKWALEFTVRPGYSLCSHTEKVRELMFKEEKGITGTKCDIGFDW